MQPFRHNNLVIAKTIIKMCLVFYKKFFVVRLLLLTGRHRGKSLSDFLLPAVVVVDIAINFEDNNDVVYPVVTFITIIMNET